MKYRIAHCLAILLAAIAVALGHPVHAQVIKRMVEQGWDAPTQRQLKRDIAVMDASPFDGVAFDAVVGTVERPFERAFSRDTWDASRFDAVIADLKATTPRKLTHNFLTLNANPGDVAMFDDAGWVQIVEHWRLAARIAKQGGLKGILFDPEPYQGNRPFSWLDAPNAGKQSFDATAAKARERGRQVMQAVAAEYPDITIFSMFLMSYLTVGETSGGANAAFLTNPKRAVPLHAYALLPAFLDGWLDVLPASAKLVDGNENAYRYATAADFNAAALKVRQGGQWLVSPENRNKYRAQVQVGATVYVDAHVNGLTPEYQFADLGASAFEARMAAALASVDEYVWVRSEQGNWWPAGQRDTGKNSHVDLASWDIVLPGATAALKAARDPEATAVQRARARAAGSAELVKNGAFSATLGSGLPSEWSTGRAVLGRPRQRASMAQ
jgi:hypothetical protein